MRTTEFDYPLPPELIAQRPAPARDQSRLLVLERATGSIAHRQFRDLTSYLRPGDVLVLNDSKVIPARLRGVKSPSGGEIEILLVEEAGSNDWWVMLKPGKRVRPGTAITVTDRQGATTAVQAVVQEKNPEGHCRLRFSGTANILGELDRLGEVPLPPYIARPGRADAPADFERYQTVFARPAGSVAAPTAGLHFTAALLDDIRRLGVEVRFVTLHVGLGTFAPVKAERVEDHVMHAERFELPAATAEAINAAKRDGRRVIAVGTTTVRVLESVAARSRRREEADRSGSVSAGALSPRTPESAARQVPLSPQRGEGSGVRGADISAAPGRPEQGAEVEAAAANENPPPYVGGYEAGEPVELIPQRGSTRLFIYPPFRFRVVDGLLTNFHLPQSTLLMLVSAFAAPGETCGREMVLRAYAEAIRERYRFYSYGDAMLIV